MTLKLPGPDRGRTLITLPNGPDGERHRPRSGLSALDALLEGGFSPGEVHLLWDRGSGLACSLVETIAHQTTAHDGLPVVLLSEQTLEQRRPWLDRADVIDGDLIPTPPFGRLWWGDIAGQTPADLSGDVPVRHFARIEPRPNGNTASIVNLRWITALLQG